MNDISKRDDGLGHTDNGGDQIGAQFRLNQVLIQWRNLILEYENQAPIAGTAEANYRGLKATSIRKMCFADQKLAISKAEFFADGEDEVKEAMFERMLEAARLDTMKRKLQWFSAEVDRLRTLVVSEREERKLDSSYQQG